MLKNFGDLKIKVTVHSRELLSLPTYLAPSSIFYGNKLIHEGMSTVQDAGLRTGAEATTDTSEN